MTPFPLLGRFNRLGTVQQRLDSLGTILEYFLNVWDRLSHRFFVYSVFSSFRMFTIPSRYFNGLDHFIFKNVRQCHNGESGFSTVINIGRKLVGRSLDVLQTNLGRDGHGTVTV